MNRFVKQAAMAALLVTMAVAGLAVAGVHPAFGGSGDHQVTICHHVEGNGNTGNGYNIETVDKDSIANVDGTINGHGLHELDAIPAFAAGSANGHEWGSFAGQGNPAIIDNNCAVPDTTTTSTTTTTTTSTTTTTTTNPCPSNDCGPGQHCTVEPCNPPPPPPCPNGEPPIHGQNGNPGNDVCNPCLPPVNLEKCPPPVTTTTTTTPPPTQTTPNDSTTISTTTAGETTTASPPETTPPPKMKPPKSKPPAGQQPPKKHPNGKPKMPPLCPVGVPANSPDQPCAVQGSG